MSTNQISPWFHCYIASLEVQHVENWVSWTNLILAEQNFGKVPSDYPIQIVRYNSS